MVMTVWSPALGPGVPRSICAGGATTLPVSSKPPWCLPASAEALVATSARATTGMGRSRMIFMAARLPLSGPRRLGGAPRALPLTQRAGELRARADVELAVAAREVHLDRLLGQEERLRDLLVGHPLGGHLGH